MVSDNNVVSQAEQALPEDTCDATPVQCGVLHLDLRLRVTDERIHDYMKKNRAGKNPSGPPAEILHLDSLIEPYRNT